MQPQPFNLTRYFSTLSFILIVMAGGVLGVHFRESALHQLIVDTEQRNAAMTQVFQNSLWARFSSFVDLSYVRDTETLRRADEAAPLRTAVVGLMA
ncbi:MAG: hypothetical protein QG571_773, partial [Pseudomonadota bacterium]|nr:hypothetical protein [Pseudomonadota bacterium]